MYGPRVLEWTFSNIMLPDSNVNEPLSHGFVKFEVEQNPNLTDGTLLENSAAIYFDFNTPIITNTSQHRVQRSVNALVGIDQVELEQALQIKVYPNPTTGQLHIDRKANEVLNIVLVDQLGRVLYTQTLQYELEILDCHHLPAGVYFLSMNNGKERVTQKIIKQ